MTLRLRSGSAEGVVRPSAIPGPPRFALWACVAKHIPSTLGAFALALLAPGSLAWAIPTDEATPVRAFRLFDKQRAPGLPQSTVVDLLQDESGLLWIATLDGLGTFDGTAVRRIEIDGATPDAPLHGSLYALAPRRGGGLWVGGSSRVWSFDGTTWRGIEAPGAAHSLAEDGIGRLWRVDQAGGLWRLADEEWVSVRTPDWLGPAVAVQGPAGARFGRGAAEPGPTDIDARTGPQLWIAGQHGVGMSSGGGPARVALGASPGTITAMEVAREGTCWVATADGAIHHLDAGVWRRVDLAGWNGGRIRDLEEDRQGRIWAGGLAGGVAFGTKSGPWSVWGQANGLRREGVLKLLADREGTLWISANGYGLQQWIGESWSHRNRWHDEPEGRLPVFGIGPTADGRGFLAAAFSRGIWRWDGSRMESYGESDGLEEDVRFAIEPEPGVLWVTARFGIYESRGGGRFRWIARVPTGFVYRIVRAPDGTFYATTSAHGVLRRAADGTWAEDESIAAALPDRDVKALLFRRGAQGDQMWIGTLGGLVVLENGAVQPLPEAAARAIPSAIQAVAAAGPEAGADIWVAGFGGLARLPGGDLDAEVETFGIDDGLPGRTVYSLAFDAAGSLWVGGSDGVGRLSGWGHAAGPVIDVFDTAHGLIEDECNHLGLWGAPDGAVYVGTMASLARFDPAAEAQDPAPLELRWIEVPDAGFTVGGVTVDGVPRLPADRRRVRLAWRAAWLTPTPVEYRSRVPRLGDEWSKPTTRGILELENLGPGTWTVEVQARRAGASRGAASDDEWTPPIRTRFDVEPYFHETWTFWFLCAGMLGLLVIAFVRWRTHRLRRRAAELEAAVREALAQVKVLGGLLPICAGCKMIRDDAGYWNQIETYLHQHSEAELSHGLCPDCTDELYGDFLDQAGAGRVPAGAPGKAEAEL